MTMPFLDLKTSRRGSCFGNVSWKCWENVIWRDAWQGVVRTSNSSKRSQWLAVSISVKRQWGAGVVPCSLMPPATVPAYPVGSGTCPSCSVSDPTGKIGRRWHKCLGPCLTQERPQVQLLVPSFSLAQWCPLWSSGEWPNGRKICLPLCNSDFQNNWSLFF